MFLYLTLYMQDVLGYGPFASQHGRELRVQRTLQEGVFSEKVKGPCQSVGSRLVSGQEKRHGLVAQLAIRHWLALFVPRRQQHGEEVAAVLVVRAALGNDALHLGVEARPPPAKAPHRRQRQLEHQVAEGKRQCSEESEGVGERVADVCCGTFHVGVEQRLGHCPEGETGHLLGDVQLRPVRPAVGGGQGRIHHGRGIGGDAAAVEGRLEETPLPQMKPLLAGEEPVSEKDFCALEPEALVKGLGVGEEDVADEVRVGEQVHRLPAKAEAHHVAMGRSSNSWPGQVRRTVGTGRAVVCAPFGISPLAGALPAKRPAWAVPPPGVTGAAGFLGVRLVSAGGGLASSRSRARTPWGGAAAAPC